jgi:hypothetical protein
MEIEAKLGNNCGISSCTATERRKAWLPCATDRCANKVELPMSKLTPLNFHKISETAALSCQKFFEKNSTLFAQRPIICCPTVTIVFRATIKMSVLRQKSPEKQSSVSFCIVALKEVELSLIETEPFYGMYSRFLFFLFIGYERWVNSSEMFSMFRANILGVLQKPSLPSKPI